MTSRAGPRAHRRAQTLSQNPFTPNTETDSGWRIAQRLLPARPRPVIFAFDPQSGHVGENGFCFFPIKEVAEIDHVVAFAPG